MMLQLKLKEYLDEKKIEIQWLADKTNMRYATLHDIIHKKRERVSMKNLYKIVKVLNIRDMNVLFELPPEKQKDTKSEDKKVSVA